MRSETSGGYYSGGLRGEHVNSDRLAYGYVQVGSVRFSASPPPPNCEKMGLNVSFCAHYAHRSNAIKVYNCTSGTLNPLSWEELGALTQRHSLTVPSRYIQWYPGFTFRTNRFMHLIYDMMFHFFPAFLMDTALRLTGTKPMYDVVTFSRGKCVTQ